MTVQEPRPSDSRQPLLLGEPSLADMINAIRGADVLSVNNRKLWACSTEVLAKALNRTVDQLPARVSIICWGLRWLRKTGRGDSKGLQAHAHFAKEAIAWFLDNGQGDAMGAPLLPEWTKAMALIRVKRTRLYIGPFARYCSARTLLPQHVTQSIFLDYFKVKRLTSFSLSGPPPPRLLINHWNSVCTRCRNWPGSRVDEILPYSPVKVQWEAFPLMLRTDIDDYLSSLAQPHHVVNDRRWKACKRSTIETRRRELESFARKAVEAGIKINRLRSLRILLSPGIVLPTVEAYINDRSGRPGRYAIALGRKLHGVARAIGAPPRTIAQLNVIKTRLSRHHSHALSSRAVDTIREVVSGDTWSRVVALPRSLFAEAERLRKSHHVKSRALATVALQIQILTRAPVRCCDLLAIRIGTNLRRATGQNEYVLSFPGYDPKNRIDLEFPLSVETSRMIARYLRAYHPNPKSPKWLFELSNGQRRNSNAASDAIGRVLEERVGMRIMAQQFRHAAAALILKDAPGNYQYVRRVLGHLNLQTTIKLYSAIEGMQSSDVFSNLLTRSLKTRTIAPA